MGERRPRPIAGFGRVGSHHVVDHPNEHIISFPRWPRSDERPGRSASGMSTESLTATNWPRHHLLVNADLSWQYKGWPRSVDGADLSTVGSLRLSLFRDHFMFPVMVVAEEAVAHNIATVARFCAEHGISLAPHGKTTMSPELAHLQLDAGAWAITASTASQARIFRAFGVPRIVDRPPGDRSCWCGSGCGTNSPPIRAPNCSVSSTPSLASG